MQIYEIKIYPTYSYCFLPTIKTFHAVSSRLNEIELKEFLSRLVHGYFTYKLTRRDDVFCPYPEHCVNNNEIKERCETLEDVIKWIVIQKNNFNEHATMNFASKPINKQ